MENETLQELDKLIRDQMTLLYDDNSLDPKGRLEIMQGLSFLIEKATKADELTEKTNDNLRKNAIEEAKIDLESQKNQLEKARNDLEDIKIRAQKEIEAKKIELEREKMHIENENRGKEIEIEQFKADSSRISAQAAREKNDSDIKIAETKAEADKFKSKMDNSWRKFFIEAAKVGVPAAVTVLTLGVWCEKYDMTLEYESTGRLLTTCFNKLLKFPHLMGF